MRTVLEAVIITDVDTDSTIIDKVAQRLGIEVKSVQWGGVSGEGVRGTLHAVDGTTYPFRARAKAGKGGAFEVKIGNEYKIVPYTDLVTQDLDFIIDKLKRGAS